MDLKMIRGDSRTFVRALTDAADNPIDLTGATVTMTAKSLYTDADPGVFQKTTVDGITVLDEVSGLIRIDLEPGDTSDLEGRTNRLVYDIQVEDGAGGVTTPVRGKLVVSPDVTTTITEGS